MYEIVKQRLKARKATKKEGVVGQRRSEMEPIISP